MQFKEIGGRQATTRAGAAQLLNIPLGTVRVYSSPGQRPKTGWPEPVLGKADPNSQGQDWFAVDELEAFGDAHIPPMPEPPPVHDPNRLLTLAEFGALRGVPRETMYRYVELSEPRWHQGEDGMLPRPDDEKPARHGTSYLWCHDRAVAWAFPTTPRRSTGRKPGRRPQPEDLRAVLAEPGAGTLTNKELAARLTTELGTDVTLQTIHRLKRRLRPDTT